MKEGRVLFATGIACDKSIKDGIEMAVTLLNHVFDELGSGDVLLRNPVAFYEDDVESSIPGVIFGLEVDEQVA